jgi:xanthine/uracil/vitamin C permease (AzgA family)
MSDQTSKAETVRAARLFDVRRVIGGLFTVYGVIVTILGIFDSQEEIDKAAGVRINLWIGLGMLILGLLFLLWQWWRPAEPPPPSDIPPADEIQD